MYFCMLFFAKLGIFHCYLLYVFSMSVLRCCFDCAGSALGNDAVQRYFILHSIYIQCTERDWPQEYINAT